MLSGMSHLKAWHVSGPVRTLRTEWAQWDPAKEEWLTPAGFRLVEFRADGKVSRSETHHPDRPVQRDTNSYDEAGRLAEESFQNGDDPPVRMVQVYDADGRLIRQVRHDPTGQERVTETWSYAAGGNKTRLLYLPKTEPPSDNYWVVEGVDFYWNTAGAETVATIYDSRELLSEVRLQNGQGLLRRVVFTRDESGRLVKDEMLLGEQPRVPGLPAFGDGTLLAAHLHTYDDRGRRCERVHRVPGQDDQRETFRYDDRDNLTETTADRHKPEAKVLDDGSVHFRTGTLHRTQARFAYQYNDHGNWIEKVASVRRAGQPEFTPSSIERREIQYYDPV